MGNAIQVDGEFFRVIALAEYRFALAKNFIDLTDRVLDLVNRIDALVEVANAALNEDTLHEQVFTLSFLALGRLIDDLSLIESKSFSQQHVTQPQLSNVNQRFASGEWV